MHFAENADRYKRWAAKTTVITADLSKKTASPWTRELTQRHALGGFLRSAADADDLIIVSDVDEIPQPEIVGALAHEHREPLRLHLQHCLYYANCVLRQQWDNGPVAFRASDAAQPLPGFLLGDTTTPEYLAMRPSEVAVANAGWHFSFLGGVDRVRDKLASYSHDEVNTKDLRLGSHIEQCMKYGLRFDGRVQARVIDPDLIEGIPKYLITEHPHLAYPSRPPHPFGSWAYAGFTWAYWQKLLPTSVRRSLVSRPGVVTTPLGPLFAAVNAALQVRRKFRPPRPFVPVRYATISLE